MKPKTIGYSLLSAWQKRPIDLKRLLGETYTLPPPTSALDLPMRVLVKVAHGVSAAHIEQGLTEIWGSIEQRRDNTRVASTIHVRPLGRLLKDGTRWYVIELPMSLGSYLDAVDYHRGRAWPS